MFRASHLIGTGDYYFRSRNLRAQNYEVNLIYWILLCKEVQGDRVKSNTCSYQRQSDKTSQILKMRPKSGGGAGQQQQTRGDKNLNLINNNRSRWGSICAGYIIQQITNMKWKVKNSRENDLSWWNLERMRRERRSVMIVIIIVLSWYPHISFFLQGRGERGKAEQATELSSTGLPVQGQLSYWYLICVFKERNCIFNTCHYIPV